ncbi:TraR/DksA C4-type zinc finger protein [Peribacillus acanthi]|uniref:TraR/DksA C4-type zinc finger protein n=1 Tax=Peribacillus acanthi TaxID=2171554 RepID=UPI000D3EDD92|nr:TraR/DksA C4-type zinc finger protein [Peribacillus acanthi]
MISNQQLKSLKDELLSQKASLEHTIENTKHETMEEGEKDNVGELSSYDNHPADLGSELYEREKDMALGVHAESELSKIEQALLAMEKGSYGKCKECGKDIPFERLEIVPYSLYCVEHTPDQTTASDRPGEEEILEAPHRDSFDRRKNPYIIDHEDSFQEVARYGTSETPSDYTGDRKDYSSLYRDADDNEGFTEEIETFVGNDMSGKNRSIYPNKTHEKYEEILEREDMESPIGDIPYKRTDGYTE